MFKSLKCLRKGHMYVDSRSQPGMQVCVHCRYRRPFDGLGLHPAEPAEDESPDGKA